MLKAEGYKLAAGDIVIAETGGGGGNGPPAERSLDLIQRDLTRGYITPEAAKRDYGVSIDANGSVIVTGEPPGLGTRR
jgi:N-methylhydantoinase B